MQNISKNVSLTQNILSTGLKVNSAIDNPSSYYTASSLNNRASDLNALLDSMGQAIQTIQAATQVLEASANILEQASVVAAKTLETIPKSIIAITKDMTVDVIQSLITDNAELVLAEDIVINTGLNITAQNVKINGNGHKITFEGNNDAAIHIDGGSADIKNLYIHAEGENAYGILVTNKLDNNGDVIGEKASLIIDNTNGITARGTGAERVVNGDLGINNGKLNTEIIINTENLDDYPAFKYVNEYKVTDDEGNVVDEGGWYLPALGELQQVMDNQDKIEATLEIVEGNDFSGRKWSSTEVNIGGTWCLGSSQSYANHGKAYTGIARGFKTYENLYNPLKHPEQNKIEIGQIMYCDTNSGNKLVWDKAMAADEMPEGYVAIGVITNISATGDVTIAALDTSGVISWGPKTEDTDIPNYRPQTLNQYMNLSGVITNKYQAFETSSAISVEYNQILSQYNSLISDASYKGINLLKNDNLDVRFNETGDSILKISGLDASSSAIGLITTEWLTQADVLASIRELTTALNNVRSMLEELGNSYSIIQTRQEFTDNLINILTEGADKLILADMNEESANMLAMQTRQQLATNALSLAQQASQSVLKLF